MTHLLQSNKVQNKRHFIKIASHSNAAVELWVNSVLRVHDWRTRSGRVRGPCLWKSIRSVARKGVSARLPLTKQIDHLREGFFFSVKQIRSKIWLIVLSRKLFLAVLCKLCNTTAWKLGDSEEMPKTGCGHHKTFQAILPLSPVLGSTQRDHPNVFFLSVWLKFRSITQELGGTGTQSLSPPLPSNAFFQLSLTPWAQAQTLMSVELKAEAKARNGAQQ